jgi:hypothetical protein
LEQTPTQGINKKGFHSKQNWWMCLLSLIYDILLLCWRLSFNWPKQGKHQQSLRWTTSTQVGRNGRRSDRRLSRRQNRTTDRRYHQVISTSFDWPSSRWLQPVTFSYEELQAQTQVARYSGSYYSYLRSRHWWKTSQSKLVLLLSNWQTQLPWEIFAPRPSICSS